MIRRALLFVTALVASLPAAAGPPQTLTPVAERPPAPDYTLADLDGRTHRLSELRGQVVLVNFWATWCPPCRRELPSMQRLADVLGGEAFVMHAVDTGEDEETILPFVFSTGTELRFPILLDRSSKVLKAWPVVALPTSFVIDAEGRIAYRAVGGREWDDPALVRQLRALLPDAGR
jgi:thiol-disulfide isomerase/thioredoxin